MIDKDFKTSLNRTSNDLKSLIDNVVDMIIQILEDIEQLKIKTSKPDKGTAKALLEYLAMEDGKVKDNMTAFCGKEIKQYFKWVEDYCKEQSCTQEQALNAIIEGDI